jgi:hypothetical protein
MARQRPRDEDDDDGFEVVDDPPPKRRKPATDDFEVVEDDPPRKARRPVLADDDDAEDDEREDRPRKKKKKKKSKQLGPMDLTYRDTNVAALVLFGICCSFIAIIHSGVGLVTSRDEQAKSNATLVLIVGIISFAANITIRLVFWDSK